MTKTQGHTTNEPHYLPRGEAVEIHEESLLSPRRAFVVQFRLGMGAAPERFAGRVEHLVSGQATRFHSPDDLLAFFTQVLANAETDDY